MTSIFFCVIDSSLHHVGKPVGFAVHEMGHFMRGHKNIIRRLEEYVFGAAVVNAHGTAGEFKKRFKGVGCLPIGDTNIRNECIASVLEKNLITICKSLITNHEIVMKKVRYLYLSLFVIIINNFKIQWLFGIKKGKSNSQKIRRG